MWEMIGIYVFGVLCGAVVMFLLCMAAESTFEEKDW